MTNGWVRLHKSTLENLFSRIEKGEITPLDSLVYLYCFSHVNFKRRTWGKTGMTIGQGEMATSKAALAKACRCTRETIIHALRRLADSGLVKMEQAGKILRLTIVNYQTIRDCGTVGKSDTSTTVGRTDTSKATTVGRTDTSTVGESDTSTVGSSDTLLRS